LNAILVIRAVQMPKKVLQEKYALNDWRSHTCPQVMVLCTVEDSDCDRQKYLTCTFGGSDCIS